MIVRNQPDHFILIQQHDHALLSGTFAENWGGHEVPALPEPEQALVLAVRLHDIGWQGLDAAPFWNPEMQQPYSFIDQPLDRKLVHYRLGIDLVQQEDLYAALLCSLHYTSFFPPDRLEALGPAASSFLEDERVRQGEIERALLESGRTIEWRRRHFDLNLLKLWDDLSLYACLNEPGAAKTDEHPWYRDGFRAVQMAYRPADINGEISEPVRLLARWLDNKRIALSPFPLARALEVQLDYRRLSKKRIASLGFERCFEESPPLRQRIAFVNGGRS